MMDLEQHLLRQMAHSHATFGPGQRTKGVIAHIRKECEEVEKANGDASEWVDLVILALDGLTRRLAYARADVDACAEAKDAVRADPAVVARTACNMIVGKQSRNEARVWPDWRTAPKDQPIEHVRSEAEALAKLRELAA